MRVITIKRTLPKQKTNGSSRNRQPIRQLARNFPALESHLEFAIEALLFIALLATSTWPIIAAAIAINNLLQILVS
jgi:hypothetical protein